MYACLIGLQYQIFFENPETGPKRDIAIISAQIWQIIDRKH